MENEYRTTSTLHPEVTIGNWILTLIVTMIPILNIIMLFVWSFSRNTNLTKSNWAKAMLILIAVWIILGLIFGSYFVSWFSRGYHMPGGY